MIWEQVWKPWRCNFDDIGQFTEDEIAWMVMQTKIDDGQKWCGSCEQFGRHEFCGRCGRRFHGAEWTWRECPECKLSVPCDFCPMCGCSVADDFLRAWEAGEIDMEQESQMAARIMERFYRARPDLAPEGYRQHHSFAQAVVEAFR